MPEGFRKFLRPGPSPTGSPGSLTPAPGGIPSTTAGRRLDHTDWLRDEPWLSAPAALAVEEPGGELAWNLACRALLKEAVGGSSVAWRRWLQSAVQAMESAGRTRDILAAGPDRSLALELRLGPRQGPDGSRVLFLREVPALPEAGGPGVGNAAEPADWAGTLNALNHELRSPLAAIKGSLSLVLRGETGFLGPDQERFLSIAMRNIERLERLTTDMLDASGGRAGKLAVRPQEIDLGPLLREGVRLQAEAARAKGLVFDAQGLPRSYLASIDPDRLMQVLENILGNAVKFTDPPGMVRIWLEQRPVPPRTVAWLLAEHCFLPLNLFTLVVEDSGRGISPAAQSGLFEPFARVQDQGGAPVPGSGLGLHITRGLLAAMQGTIRLASRPGQGTTVWVRLPRDPESRRLLEVSAELESQLGGGDPDPVRGDLGVLDLREGMVPDPEIDRLLQVFLAEAAESGAGRGLEVVPGLWAAAVRDRESWDRQWDKRRRGRRIPDHRRRWRMLPGSWSEGAQPPAGAVSGNLQGPAANAELDQR